MWHNFNLINYTISAAKKASICFYGQISEICPEIAKFDNNHKIFDFLALFCIAFSFFWNFLAMAGNSNIHTVVFIELPLAAHPPPDTPQKKNQKTHLKDRQIYQVEGIDIPKQEVAKSSQSRFFNKINSRTL